jgi:hypothetical protein
MNESLFYNDNNQDGLWTNASVDKKPLQYADINEIKQKQVAAKMELESND